MFEDLNFHFHGVLLDPLIEDSCGPLINCDSCSTFDGTSPVLASPSSAIFNGGYQLTISSNTTSLFTCNFRVEVSQPHFGLSVRMKLARPKVGTWNPLGLPKI